ncbi:MULTISPECIES: hypothetical protein [unclassified Moritella]|uniref:hypothetical protein n=1 Tax=Moritella sp. F3 TaxID=2718882 RepID=UPI0018E18CE9|nr:hypothetical protein FMO001_04580 [Moritella sp. F1]GIC81821.1 hypothetical protein FMO003_21020 [Moritella sp. F3]
MRITKPTNNANISLLLIVTFLVACMVNNAYTFNKPVVNAEQFRNDPLNSQDNLQHNSQGISQENSTVSTVVNAELYDASYLDNSDGVCKLTEKLLQKASTHMDELVMVILMIIMFNHYFMRQTPNTVSLTTRLVPSQRRHLILCKFDE